MQLYGNISRNGYGNAVIGRYGGCFAEDVGLMCKEQEKVLPRSVDVLAKDAPTLKVRKGNAQYRRG